MISLPNIHFADLIATLGAYPAELALHIDFGKLTALVEKDGSVAVQAIKLACARDYTGLAALAASSGPQVVADVKAALGIQ